MNTTSHIADLNSRGARSMMRRFAHALIVAGFVIGAQTASAGSVHNPEHYEIDWDNRYIEKVPWWGDVSGARVHGGSCRFLYDNGAVRSWFLKERNANDFRKSYHFCRNIDEETGGLEGTPRKESHFAYDGSGTTGSSKVPFDFLYADGSTDRYGMPQFVYGKGLPIGVMTSWNVGLSMKLKDVNITYSSTDEIIEETGSQFDSDWAFGRSGYEYRLTCNDGYVMTGIWVKADHSGVGGANQAEIRAVRIQCARLRLR